MSIVLSSPQKQALLRTPIPITTPCSKLQQPILTTRRIPLSPKTPTTSLTAKCQHQHQQQQQSSSHTPSLQQSKPRPKPKTQDDGIPAEDVKLLVKFKSRHNYIRVLEVSRKAQHPFRGCRLLLLDGPGNIHSISFLHKALTNTYFDVFATLPPILPPGPIAILGFGAGSAARIVLELYPDVTIHGWELDPSVIEVAREYFNLRRIEREHKERLFIYVGNALKASLKDGFAGIMVDLFAKGSLIPELQDAATWEAMRGCLRKGGRVMVNVGGRCVEAESRVRDHGKVVMEETLRAMKAVFGDEKVFVLSLGNREDDSSVALTGDWPLPDEWKMKLRDPLPYYVDLWKPYSGS